LVRNRGDLPKKMSKKPQGSRRPKRSRFPDTITVDGWLSGRAKLGWPSRAGIASGAHCGAPAERYPPSTPAFGGSETDSSGDHQKCHANHRQKDHRVARLGSRVRRHLNCPLFRRQRTCVLPVRGSGSELSLGSGSEPRQVGAPESWRSRSARPMVSASGSASFRSARAARRLL
jgi:hypothetical protein